MTSYQKNQLVWAKVKGYPWWPATIARPNQAKNGTIEARVLVNFVGEKTHAIIALDKVADYDEKFKQYSAIKSKKLQEAVKAAQRKLDGFSSEEESSDDEVDEKLVRRLKKKATRESSSTKDLRRIGGISSSDIDDDQEDEDDEIEKRRLAKLGKLGNKIREKEMRAIKRNDSPVDTTSGRYTRSRSKTSKIEMLTEPLIYTSRRNSKTPPPATPSPVKKTNSNNKATNDKKVQKQVKAPTRPGIKGRLTISTQMLKKEEKIDLEDESIIASTNSDMNDGIQGELGSKADQKAALDAEENNNELNMMLQDVDENDDLESFHLNEESSPEEEVKRAENSKANQNKRSNPTQLEGLSSKKGVTPNGQTDMKYVTGYIIKKVKPNDEKDVCGDPSVSLQARFKKVENSLERILNDLSVRFKKNEMQIDDENFLEAAEIIQEFENCNEFNGPELIGSELGKLTKTLEFLLSTNTRLLTGTGQVLALSLKRILRKIKTQILNFCLDNTSYIKTFQLAGDNDKVSDHKHRVIDIDSEEFKGGSDSTNYSRSNHVLELNKNNSSLTTAMDDEDTTKFQRTIIETITSPSLNKDDSNIVSPGACKPEAAPSVTKMNREEEEQKNTKSSHELADFNLRKKICQKFAALLVKSYALEKERSHDLTRKIESRIINFYGQDANDYKQAIKQLLKLIKADLLKIDDLGIIQNMSIVEFKEMMEQKLRLLEDDTEGSELNSSSLPNNGKKKDSKNNNDISKETANEDESLEAPRRTTRTTGKTMSKPEIEEQLIKRSVPRRKNPKKDGTRGSAQGRKEISRLRSGRRY